MMANGTTGRNGLTALYAENREEYLKGFAWDCCGEKLDSTKLGCVKGPHQEVVQRRIIRRDRASFSYY